MLFYDFEVFKHDWLVVALDFRNKVEHVIINDIEKLKKLYQDNKNNIWIGFNSRHYDQFILKGLLLGYDPKKINDFIIAGKNGWSFTNDFYKVPLNNYDIFKKIDRGLKFFEGSMGNSIVESSVPFDIDRPLTDEEIQEVVKYCRHDVEQTIEVFFNRFEDFKAQLDLVKMMGDLSLINKTNAQLAATFLNAKKKKYNDEFDLIFPDCLRLDKYIEVKRWYENKDNQCYKKNNRKNELKINVAGVEHIFGYGGVHGAIKKYHKKGYFLNIDVASLYPSLMINFNLHSRSIVDPEKYVEIYKKRLEYKAEKNPLQAPLKLVLNTTYGAMKDKFNALYDPRQANNVCVHGQLLLLDLIEKLEPHIELVQSNTDGILMKMPDGRNPDEWFSLIDDLCFEWETRTGLKLEFEEFEEVVQKDVNNYILIGEKNKTKGAYVKKLSQIDYGDFPIVNAAVVDYFINGTPVEETINGSTRLIDFQYVAKISSKYDYLLHGDTILNEKCVRVFASSRLRDPGLFKKHNSKWSVDKVSNTPERCFLANGNINDKEIPEYLDRNFYIELAKKRINDFI